MQVDLASVRRIRGDLCHALVSVSRSMNPQRRIGEAAGWLAQALAVAAKHARAGAPGLDRPAGVGSAGIGPVWGRVGAPAEDGQPADFTADELDAAVSELREWVTWAIESLDPIIDGTADDVLDCLDGMSFDVANALKVCANFAPAGTKGLDRGKVRWGRNPFAGCFVPAGEPVVYFVQADGGEPWPTARRAAVRRELLMRREMREHLIVVERSAAGVRDC